MWNKGNELICNSNGLLFLNLYPPTFHFLRGRTPSPINRKTGKGKRFEQCKVISPSVSDKNKTDTFSVRHTYFVFLIAGYVVSQESQPTAACSVLLLSLLLLWRRVAHPGAPTSQAI